MFILLLCSRVLYIHEACYTALHKITTILSLSNTKYRPRGHWYLFWIMIVSQQYEVSKYSGDPNNLPKWVFDSSSPSIRDIDDRERKEEKMPQIRLISKVTFIHMRFAWKAWVMPDICMRYSWDMHEICMIYTWDISERYLRYIWDYKTCILNFIPA